MTKKKFNVRETSLMAYAEVLENLGERQVEVYKTIRGFGDGGCNNKMIAKHLKLPINSITGRVNELRKCGIVIHYKKDICPITLKKENKERLTIFWRVRKRL